jgi:hypothetical protein
MYAQKKSSNHFGDTVRTSADPHGDLGVRQKNQKY